MKPTEQEVWYAEEVQQIVDGLLEDVRDNHLKSQYECLVRLIEVVPFSEFSEPPYGTTQSDLLVSCLTELIRRAALDTLPRGEPYRSISRLWVSVIIEAPGRAPIVNTHRTEDTAWRCLGHYVLHNSQNMIHQKDIEIACYRGNFAAATTLYTFEKPSVWLGVTASEVDHTLYGKPDG